MRQARPGAPWVRSQSNQSCQREAGGPQQRREGQGTRERGRAVGLLTQNHAEPMQSDHRHRLEGHDNEARAGEVEGKAEAARHSTSSISGVQKQHQREHGRSDTANEKVTEGQVEDHEVEVGAELTERRVEERQENHQVAVRTQAKDEDQQEGAGGERGCVDQGPAARGGRLALGAVEAPRFPKLSQVQRPRGAVHGTHGDVKRSQPQSFSHRAFRSPKTELIFPLCSWLMAGFLDYCKDKKMLISNTA